MPRTTQPRQYALTPIPQGPDPMQTMAGMMQLAYGMERVQEQQREQKTRQAYEGAMREAKGDLSGAAAVLERDGYYDEGRQLRTRAGDIRKQLVNEAETRIGKQSTIFGQASQLLTEVEQDPSLYPSVRANLVDLAAQLDPRLASEIPETYDPNAVKGMVKFVTDGVTATTQYAAATKAAKDALDGQKDALERRKAFQTAIATGLMAASDGETWEGTRQTLRTLGAPPDLLESAGEWEGDGTLARERARRIGLTPEQAKAEAASPPTTFAAALLRAKTPAEKNEIVALAGRLDRATRAPSGTAATPDLKASAAAITANPDLFWAITPDQRSKLLPVLHAQGFTIPAKSGLTKEFLEQRRLDDIRDLNQRRMQMNAADGTRLMSDAMYQENLDRIEALYRDLRRGMDQTAAAPIRPGGRDEAIGKTLPPNLRRPVSGAPATPAAQAPATSGVALRLPNGQVATFPDQASAEAFMKAAGLAPAPAK